MDNSPAGKRQGWLSFNLGLTEESALEALAENLHRESQVSWWDGVDLLRSCPTLQGAFWEQPPGFLSPPSSGSSSSAASFEHLVEACLQIGFCRVGWRQVASPSSSSVDRLTPRPLLTLLFFTQDEDLGLISLRPARGLRGAALPPQNHRVRGQERAVPDVGPGEG